MPQPWKSQPWVEAYDLALLEFDLTKLPEPNRGRKINH